MRSAAYPVRLAHAGKTTLAYQITRLKSFQSANRLGPSSWPIAVIAMPYELTEGAHHRLWWQNSAGSFHAFWWCIHCDDTRRHLARANDHHPLWQQRSAGWFTKWLCAHGDDLRSDKRPARSRSSQKCLLHIDDVWSDP